MKYRIISRFYDKVEGLYYEPSTSFVEVPEHVAKRLNELGEFVAIKETQKTDDKPTTTKKPTKSKSTD